MLAGHALALVGVPMRRVVRIMRDQRDQRYRLLRGWFHGADDASVDELAEERLQAFTLPDAVEGRRLADVLAPLEALRPISMRSHTGAPLPIDPDTVLQGGETLVLSGTAEPLARAANVLAA